MKTKLALAFAATLCTATAFADAGKGVNDSIKFRQSGYAFMAWNMGKIKAQLEKPETFNKDQVLAAANVIAAVANSGMGALYAPGTETGKGWEPTRAKPELFKEKEEVGKLAGNFRAAADNLAKAAAGGEQGAVKAAWGEVGKTCKACHDKYREKE